MGKKNAVPIPTLTSQDAGEAIDVEILDLTDSLPVCSGKYLKQNFFNKATLGYVGDLDSHGWRLPSFATIWWLGIVRESLG